MFAIDTNLLIYAHNEDAEFHEQSAQFLERVFNESNADGQLSICLSTQVITEFMNVMTRQTLRKPLAMKEAIRIVQDYLDTGFRYSPRKIRKSRRFSRSYRPSQLVKRCLMWHLRPH